MSYDKLKDEQQKIILEIDQAMRGFDTKLETKLTIDLYNNKIALLEAINDEDNRRRFINGFDLHKKVLNMPTVPRYETGIRVLDEAFKGGIEVGTFMQLIGESGVGKSHLMFELISNVTKFKEVAFFSFEMGERRTNDRMFKKCTKEEHLKNWKIDFHSRNITDLVNEIKLFSRDGIKFFVIDSMMKIETTASKDLIEHQRIISHELAKVSQDRDIIVCLINQMNKADIKDGRLDVKGAGDQEYDSDILLFYRKDEKGNRQLVCKKNRQDEKLFTLELKLDDNGNTISKDEVSHCYENIKETEIPFSMHKV